MEPRYSRNLPALSEQDCLLLHSKRIAVIGCGGIGGYLIELLSRIGVGYLRVVDSDVFDESNFNRQLLLEHSFVGRFKAEIAAARVQRINAQIAVEPIIAHLDEANAVQLIAGCDLVLDGLDSIDARRILSAACTKANIPYIYGAISGWVAQAAISLPGDGLIEALYPADVTIRDKSVLSFTPALCASIQVSLAIKMLLDRPVNTGVLYYFDTLHHEFETIPLV